MTNTKKPTSNKVSATTVILILNTYLIILIPNVVKIKPNSIFFGQFRGYFIDGGFFLHIARIQIILLLSLRQQSILPSSSMFFLLHKY